MKPSCKQRTWIPVIILIVSGLLLIGGVSASEFSPWSIQTVDSGGKVGQYSSVALDAAGNPAISYYDETYGDLKYASWDGSTWVITTVDCSKAVGKNKWFFWDRSHDRTQDREYISCFHGTEKVGKYSSLAFDSTGKPRISFYDESKSDLKYASWDGSTWVVTTVSSTGKVGEYSSLAFDSNDKPRISFYDKSKSDLKYASWDGSTWVVTTVDSYGKVGEYSSLALDSTGNPRISYYDESKTNLKYAAWDGSTWVITTVDGTRSKEEQKKKFWDGDRGRVDDRSKKVGKYSSLALDSTGLPRIGYYDESNKDLKYAAFNGSTWVITTVDSSKRVGEYASLKLDTNGAPRISYYDATNHNLKFASWNSTTSQWVTETVDSSRKVGSFSSLALDSLGAPCISFYDQSKKDLKYAAGTAPVHVPTGLTVTGISPASGPASGGTNVTVTGSGFTGAQVVMFGDLDGYNLIVTSDTRINITSPPSSAGTVDITVITGEGTSAASPADQFTYIPAAPTVTGISPANGPATGGTEVTVTGTAFTGATAVMFGTTAGTSLIVTNDTHLSIASPAGAAGTVDITVITSGGTSAASPADQFTFVAAPTITGISPASGPATGGTEVTVTGTAFTGATAVMFGTTAGTSLTVTDDTHLSITSPAGAAGTVDVTVITPGGTSAASPADKFTYIAAPTITAITPATGIAGTSVTVTDLAGTGFLTGATVNLTKSGSSNITATAVTVDSSTKITCTLPLPAASATSAGKWTVVVTNTDGQSAILADAFTVTNPAPTVTGITPATGVSGSPVSAASITGTNFIAGTTPSVSLVKSGEDDIIATDVVVDSSTRITCSFPTLPSLETSAGQWDVVVTNEDTQSGTLSGGFTIEYPTPTVISVIPSTAAAGTQVDVEITGTNFNYGANPSIWLEKTGADNITAENVYVDQPSLISCTFTIPAAAPVGEWNIMILNLDGQSATKLGAFTITEAVVSSQTWDWSVDGWTDWAHTASWTGTITGDCAEITPYVESGHGVHGASVNIADRTGSVESSVTKTFTAPAGTTYNTLTFSGMLDPVTYPALRTLTITVNDVPVFTAKASKTPPGNGQQFTITQAFTPANTVTVKITSRMSPHMGSSTTLYTMQFNSLTVKSA